MTTDSKNTTRSIVAMVLATLALIVAISKSTVPSPTTAPSPTTSTSSGEHRVGGFQPWGVGTSGGTPGGLNTQLQYDNAGAFGGISGFTTDGTNVTASSAKLTLDNSHIDLGTNAHPIGGFFRIPYNAGSGFDIIQTLDSTATSRALLTYNAGDSWTFGNASQDLHLVGFNNSSLTLSTGFVLTASGADYMQATSGVLYLGTDNTFAGGATVTDVSASSAVGLNLGGVTYFYVNSATAANEAWKPIIGGAGASSPWSGMNGTARVTLVTGTTTATAADSAMTYISLGGSPNSFNYDLPAVSSLAQGYAKYVYNGTGVSGTVRMVGDATHTCPYGATTGAWIWIDTGGCHQLTAGFATTNPP